MKNNSGIIPNAVHGRHSKRDPFEAVDEMVEEQLKKFEVGSNRAYPYTLGVMEGKMGMILSHIKHRDPRMYEELLEIYFKEKEE